MSWWKSKCNSCEHLKQRIDELIHQRNQVDDLCRELSAKYTLNVQELSKLTKSYNTLCKKKNALELKLQGANTIIEEIANILKKPGESDEF